MWGHLNFFNQVKVRSFSPYLARDLGLLLVGGLRGLRGEAGGVRNGLKRLYNIRFICIHVYLVQKRLFIITVAV